MIRSLRRLALAVALTLGAATAAHAQAGDAILILDASGSMWGRVDGQTKISAARRAVDSILAKWRPQDRLGLMAYGHRSKGQCDDIELVVPVGAFDAGRIKAAVRALSPKGKTPIADSLRAAARALRSSENKATVILVSDGIETCAPDPCAVAAELKKSGVHFTAHVIGFDVADPVAKSQLQCIARATGGVYLDARNADGLENALGRAVEAVQGAKVKSEAPAKQQAEDPLKGKNFRGNARLVAGGDPISDTKSDVSWGFFKPNAEGEKGEHVTTFYGAPVADVVEPGDYVVEVKYGYAARDFKLRVERNKPAILDVVLDAGYVTSEGAVLGAGKADNVAWEVHHANGEYVATDYEPVPRFILPAGDYVLTLSKGASKTKQAFSIAAGDTINVSLTLDVGKLQVSAVYAASGPKIEQGISVEVKQLPKADGQDGEWIATLYDPLSQFDLPAGTYDVTVGVGFAKRTVRAEVRSGEPTRLNVDVQAGVAAISAPAANAIEIFRPERDINNQRPYVGTFYDPEVSIALNAGEYIAIVTYKDDTKVERPFSVAPGKRANIQIAK